MTNQSDEPDVEPGGIGDDQLPEDLQPSDDNPLAQPLEPGEAPDVDLNEPSSSYAKEQHEDEEPDDSGESGESDQD